MSITYRNMIPQHFVLDGISFENACFNCPLDCEDCIFGQDHPFFVYPLEEFYNDRDLLCSPRSPLN